MIRKSYPAVTKVLDESEGLVEAVVNCTAVVDLQRDVMEPGCFAEVVKAAREGEAHYPSVCWNHDWGTTVGKVLEMDELSPGDGRLPEKLGQAGAGGLYIKAAYNLATQRGREAFSDVKFGAVRQWSIGFIPAEDAVRYDKGVRRIAKVADLPEVSNVLVGASPGTFTAAAKSGETSEDRRERSTDRLTRAKAAVEGFKATWSAAMVNDLPDSAFAYIEPGGKKDSDGKTTPRSLRHFPHHGPDGGVDLPHLRNALARAPQSPFGDKAMSHLKRHAKAEGVGDDDGGKAHGHDHGHEDDHFEHKDLPDLQGEEAQHVGPLRNALAEINRLIAQELGEDDPEYDCVIRLACIGQDLIGWANGEAQEYGGYGGYADSPVPMTALMAAGHQALTKGETPSSGKSAQEPPGEPAAAVEAPDKPDTSEEPQAPPPADSEAESAEEGQEKEKSGSLPTWWVAGWREGIRTAFADETTTEAPSEPPQHHVPEQSGEQDGLTHWARARARPRR